MVKAAGGEGDGVRPYVYNAETPVSAHSLKFSRLSGLFAICQLPTNSDVPGWALQGPFVSLTRTVEELSVVCHQGQVPTEVQHESDWVCLKLEGPFPFSQTGVLSSFIEPLADQAISIFALSTFDTDYVLVKKSSLDRAVDVLQQAGHTEI
jgi:hypothetical protein